MSKKLLTAILSAFVCLAAQTGEAMAQQRVTSSDLEQLKDKVETQRGAYHLLDMAEKEAREEGALERAAAFSAAKGKAREQYYQYNEELKKAQAQKSEQDKRAAQLNPDYK